MASRRRTSGLFAAQHFREAFLLFDHDKDGWIAESDLRHVFASLGIAPPQPALLAAHPTGVNLAMFLTMMNDHLAQFDPDTDLADAFACFDDTDAGTVKADEMRRWLADVGDRMDPREIDAFLSGTFTDRHGNFHYREWIKVLRADEPESAC